MFNQGLSLDQAPPIAVVLRFFLSLPFFGTLLAILMILYPHAIITPSHPVSLAAIHLFFLGVITMSMIGALFQMQSVLGGRPIPAPGGNALIIHTFLTAGVLSLCSAFLFTLAPLFILAAVLLGAALIYTANLILPLLFGEITHDTLRGMRLSLISLAITALFGIVMASSYANNSFSPSYDAIRTSHYSLGLIGWIATLIIAVAFQVVEMFYVTSPYSLWCKRNGFRIITASLALKILWLFLELPYVWVFDGILAALLFGFIATTVRRLRERKRRVSDVSIWFWAFGLLMLCVSLISHLLCLITSLQTFEIAALLGFGTFALSIILGMIGKIVPFLVWFHLNAAGYMETPIMSNVIPAPRNKTLFILLVIGSVSAFLALLNPLFFRIAGIGVLALFVVLGYNLIAATRLYRHIRLSGKRFEFSPPQE
ncbi:MAG: hypothetical protein AB7U44_06845 [Sulfuricurvum sp.]